MADSSSTVLQGEAAGLSFLHQANEKALSCALANLEVLFGPASVERSGSLTDQRIPGSLVVTTSAILFWNPTDIERDLWIPGELIDLHAILANEEDLPMALYLQISSSDDDDDDTLQEFNIYIDSKCEELFRAVTKLIELHPHAISEDDEDDDGMIMVSDDQRTSNDKATFEEREEMLERLDRLLVVPPEYEVDEEDSNEDGQFDDAEEEQDLL